MVINTMTSTKAFILTNRERDILILVGKGLTNAEIAQELGISTRTVKSTLHRVCVKMGVRNRAQAIMLALKHKAIDIQEVLPIEGLAEMYIALGPETIGKIAQNLKKALSVDELAEMFIALGPETIGRVAQNLKRRYGPGNLPADIEYLSQLKKEPAFTNIQGSD